MNNQEKIEREIDKIMGLFDKKESLPPNPYFFTRVQARISEKSSKEFPFSALLKPAFFTALVVLNLTTAIWYTNTDGSLNQMDTGLELVDLLKSDLNLENDQSESLIFE